MQGGVASFPSHVGLGDVEFSDPKQTHVVAILYQLQMIYTSWYSSLSHLNRLKFKVILCGM